MKIQPQSFFEKESGAVLNECDLYALKNDGYYAASPDRIFEGKTSKNIVERNTDKEVTLPDFLLLEINARDKENYYPLPAVTGCHIAQTQLQMKCAEATICILQSYVPGTEIAKYFISAFIDICNAFLNNTVCSLSQPSCSKYIQSLPIGEVPEFENMLPLR